MVTITHSASDNHHKTNALPWVNVTTKMASVTHSVGELNHHKNSVPWVNVSPKKQRRESHKSVTITHSHHNKVVFRG
eukprot:11297914-Prorocentrum_lima.AAC.1